MDYIQLPSGDPILDEHIKHIHNVDWASTPAGPCSDWPKDLAVLLHTIMRDPAPRLLCLGEGHNMLYNPAYAEFAGDLHPGLLGLPIEQGWSEYAHLTAKNFAYAKETGLPHVQDDMTILVRRAEGIEEVVLQWTTLEVKGSMPGFLISVTNTTAETLGRNRRALLRTFSDEWSCAQDSSSLWSCLSRSISFHPREFPFALLYSATLAPDMEQSQDFILDAHDASQYGLRSFIGNPAARPLVPVIIGSEGDRKSYSDILRRAIMLKKPQLARVAGGEVPEGWIRAAEAMGRGDALKMAVIIPLLSHRTGVVFGVMVLGLDTRSPWNESYRNWINDIGKSISDVFTSLFVAEDANRKQHQQAKEAAREQVLLAKELALRQREASDANDKAKRLLKLMQDCDVGIFEYSPSGALIQANDAWYQLSGHPRPADTHSDFSFMDCVFPEDRQLVVEKWGELAAGHQTSFEMRWKPQPPKLGEDPCDDGLWVLSSSIPVYDDNDVLIAISGLTTNISPQKRSIRDAERRAEAVERARASEQQANLANERFQRMSKAIDLIDVGVFDLTTDGRIVSANDAYWSLSGIPNAADEAMVFTDYIYPEDFDYVMRQWDVMTANTPVSFEMRWKAPERAAPGGPDPGRWILAACFPITDAEGNVTNIFGCTTDIDAQKRAESETRRRVEALERARASETRFLRFTDSSAVPIYILEHPSRRVTYCNDAWFMLTDQKRTDYNNIDWRSVVHKDDMPLLERLWDAIAGNKETVSVQIRLKRMWTSPSGEALSPIWVMATANPEFNEDGSVKGIMGTMSDITGFKWAETSQQTRINEAIEAKRQQENFIDMTSHEIRNPLGAIVHCTDSICDSLTEMKNLAQQLMLTEHVGQLSKLFELIDGSVESVNTITSCSGHMLRIANDILVLSKLDSNLLQIAPAPTSVKDVLRDIEHMFITEATRAGVTVRTEVDRSLQDLQVSYALLDAGRALQILINLVTNAIKFTKNREVRQVTIKMGASKDRPSEEELKVDFALSHSMRDSIYDTDEFAGQAFYIWFTVTDTGRGMTVEEKARIFARFTQGSPRTYSEYGGSGLGLFISRELAGLQGGEIGVASEAGKGSTFAFFVKTRHTPAPKNGLPILPSRTNSGSVVKPQEVSILVTEDNLLNQKVLKKQLAKHGYKVYTADNGQEALDFLKTTRRWRDQHKVDAASETPPGQVVDVDVILMDIEMPVMGGLQSARCIRDYQEDGSITSHIPIIAVSANARAEQTALALAAGMDDAISKPFRIVDLIPKIDKMANWAKMLQK